MAELAPLIGCRLIVLAALVEEFPDHVCELAQSLAPEGGKVLLLNLNDLEKGLRHAEDGRRIETIDDHLPPTDEDVDWQRAPGPRSYNFY